MDQRLDALQARLDGLVSELNALRRRVETLEARSEVHAGAPGIAAADRVDPVVAAQNGSETEALEPAIL